MKRSVAFSAIIVTLFLVDAAVLFVTAEIDKTSFVTEVIDGDTFHTSVGDRVRLADIDAPERNASGYSQAKDYLASWVYRKTVYLDIDDLYRTDKYGRLVCVVFVDYNETHLLNVNKALVAGGYAVVRNYDNEFNPSTWSLFVLKSVSPTPTLSPTPSPIPSPTSSPIPSSTPSPSPTAEPTPAPTPVVSPTPGSGTGIFLPISAVFGILGILAITAMLLFLLLRKKH